MPGLVPGIHVFEGVQDVDGRESPARRRVIIKASRMSMRLMVDSAEIFAGSGGRAHDRTQPLIVFLHGAGLDHSVWALLARWFAHRGWSVVAPDLPGHGRSEGEPLASIAAMADWTAKLIEACGAGKAMLVGHSMGSLIALETAARHGARVNAVALIGTAAAMPVARDLLAAA
jgi:pimeloyl-ACP methyl ester carboxylesterase